MYIQVCSLHNNILYLKTSRHYYLSILNFNWKINFMHLETHKSTRRIFIEELDTDVVRCNITTVTGIIVRLMMTQYTGRNMLRQWKQMLIW
jgi:hypothetical protein